MEHVQNPERIVEEMLRVLKSGGKVYSDVDFMTGFHASPFDFNRMTTMGLRKLFEEYDDVRIIIGSGPTSALLWIFQEWLAMILSLGIKQLYKIFYLIIMALTFPIKYLDVLLQYHPMAENISASFIVTAKKREIS